MGVLGAIDPTGKLVNVQCDADGKLLGAGDETLVSINSYLEPLSPIGYGRIGPTDVTLLVENGITWNLPITKFFHATNASGAGEIQLTVPDGTRELRIRTDAAANKVTLYFNTDEIDGVGIPISGLGVVDPIPFVVDASLGTNVCVIQLLGTHGATYVQVTAFGAEV